jgi:methyltransferase-like protein/SAM-dependent methyltransferase
MSEPTNTYDDLPYEDKPMWQTHPDNIAAVATFHGMTPPPPERCRVLELGCASGQNLLAMAVSLPKGHFGGIDLSPRQIAAGVTEVEALGLANVDLRAMSVLDVDRSFGTFDYIIAHGIYSWVPPDVQTKILQVCAQNLAANGVAYVSYNTYPGWHQRAMVREMMAYHVRKIPDARTRIDKARAFVSFLVDGQPPDSKATYAKMIQDEAKLLCDAADSYVFHEHLEEVNQPLYFHEFMERAAAQGLQYLGEARPHCPWSLFSANARAALEALAGDTVRQEQYLDFLRNRTFRWTLLCHQRVALDRRPAPDRMTAFWFIGQTHPATHHPDVTTDAPLDFKSEDFSVTVNQPLVKAALVELSAAWPLPVSFETLGERVWDRLKHGCAQDLTADAWRPALAGALLDMYRNNLVRLGVSHAAFTTDAGELPIASTLVRRQAARSQRFVSSLRHTFVEVGEHERRLLSLLDGTRDRQKLAQEMAAVVNREDLEAGWLATTLEHFGFLALLPATQPS